MAFVRSIAVMAIAAALSIGAHGMPLSQGVAGPAVAASKKASQFGVGDTLPSEVVHVITHPGRYGLGPQPDGSRYAVAHGMLIRIDDTSFKVKSILRLQAKLLD